VLLLLAAGRPCRRQPPHRPHHLQQALEVWVAHHAAGEGWGEAGGQQGLAEAEGQLAHPAVGAARARLV
jgi:hypothetical protein